MASTVTFIIIGSLSGLLIGGVLCWLFLKARHAKSLAQLRAELDPPLAVLQERCAAKDKEIQDLTASAAQKDQELKALHEELLERRVALSQLETTLEKERLAAKEKLDLLNQAQASLTDAFKALSSDALKSNNQSFLQLAEEKLKKFQETAKGDLEKRQQAIELLVKPVKESLDKFDTKIQQIERDRVGAYTGLTEQVKNLLETQNQLRSETSNLVRALGTPRIRGQWGEIQLRRVVEIAGMLEYCDFQEQKSVTTEEGRLRPDLIVRLPGGRNIVVDAKAPLAAYLEALELDDEAARKVKLLEHARQIREHVVSLSRKSYWDQFQPSPDFVVLFLPAESFYQVAVQHDLSLIEDVAYGRVLLATPMTLIALLKTAAYGWRQESLANNAKIISDLGKELYKRLSDLYANFSDLGSRLGKAVESYNKAVFALESRVLVSARRFHELEASGGQEPIEPLVPIETTPRTFTASELLMLTEGDAHES